MLARAKEWFLQTGDLWGCVEVIDRVKVWLREQGGVWVADRYTLALDRRLVEWTRPSDNPPSGVRVVGPSAPDDGPKRPGIALPIPPSPRPPLELVGARVGPGRKVRGRGSADGVPQV